MKQETLLQVPNDPLRRRFEESGESLAEVAIRLGWCSKREGRMLPWPKYFRPVGLGEALHVR